MLPLVEFFQVTITRRQSRSYIAHTHDHYEFHYIFNGDCAFVRAGRARPSPDGTFLFFSPGEVHYIDLEPGYGPVSHFKFHGRLESGDDDLRDLLERRIAGKQVHVGTGQRLFFEEWRRRADSSDPDDAVSARLEMLSFLYRLPGLAAAARGVGTPVTIERALTRIHGSIYGRLDFEALVAESGYSDSYFSRRFRAVTGLPPKQYYLRLKVETAHMLLRETDLSISEIAAQLHFTDAFYFSKTFKQWTGMPPSAARG
jgi:AraC-like DNA-binding protein